MGSLLHSPTRMEPAAGQDPSAYRFEGHFDGFSCYYNPSALYENPEESHGAVEIAVLFENAIAKLSWQENQAQHEKVITAGQVCIIPIEQPHQLIQQQPGPLLAIHLSTQLIIEATHQTLRTPSWSLAGDYGVEDPTLIFLADTLRGWLTQTGEIADLYRKSLVKLIAVHLIAHYASADFKAENKTELFTDLKIGPTLNYIHNNLDKPLKVPTLAKSAGLSQSHFCRVFKKSVGLSPYRYILSQRIHKAKRLLSETDLDLSEISFRCGFYDQSHFIFQFRRFTGTTPKNYRAIPFNTDDSHERQTAI
ncbi:MAG: AraC family transcriptional regulator [Cyanobacteria bacterium J06614_10]